MSDGELYRLDEEGVSMLPMKDLLVLLPMTVILIVGIYQFYFLTQNHMLKPARQLSTWCDDRIPFRPSWVWIYSGLYYPVIIVILLTMEDIRHFNFTVMSFVVLLLMQMAFFRYFPVETPPEWREFGEREGIHISFLRLVQRYDDNTNCFPNMHVSVSTLTALHIMANEPWLGAWPLLFPVVIAVSAIYTKQHYLLDLAPGAALGWFAWQIHLAFTQ